jgi:hypothetical protein
MEANQREINAQGSKFIVTYRPLTVRERIKVEYLFAGCAMFGAENADFDEKSFEGNYLPLARLLLNGSTFVTEDGAAFVCDEYEACELFRVDGIVRTTAAILGGVEVLGFIKKAASDTTPAAPPPSATSPQK